MTNHNEKLDLLASKMTSSLTEDEMVTLFCHGQDLTIRFERLATPIIRSNYPNALGGN